MEKLLEILKDIKDDVDFETCTTLIDDKILDSLSLLSLVSELQDEYDIQITPAELIPENFNSAKSIYEMIQKLQ